MFLIIIITILIYKVLIINKLKGGYNYSDEYLFGDIFWAYNHRKNWVCSGRQGGQKRNSLIINEKKMAESHPQEVSCRPDLPPIPLLTA